MSEERSPMEREADKRAHKVAQEVCRVLEIESRGLSNPTITAFLPKVFAAAKQYREIQRRQIEEATR